MEIFCFLVSKSFENFLRFWFNLEILAILEILLYCKLDHKEAALITWESNHHPLSKNCDSSGAEHLLNIRPVCKFEIVCCGEVEKKTEHSIYPSLVMVLRWSSKTPFSIYQTWDFDDFRQIPDFQKNFKTRAIS